MKHNLPIGTAQPSVNWASRSLTVAMMFLAFMGLWQPKEVFGVGSWSAVGSQPGDNIGICLLLPDGTVMAEGSSNAWWALTPDSTGNYSNGTWTRRVNSTWGHQDGSTAVLTNGNVFVAGGENGNGINQVEIYNPVTGLWSVAINPAPVGSGGISDGNAMLLPNDEVMIYPEDNETWLFNPANNTLSLTTGQPRQGIGEVCWVKLPNDNILTIDSDNSSSGATTAEYYDPSTGTWQNAVTGGTVPNIWPNMNGTGDVSEMGPAFLLPNGNAIFFGGNGVTAVYDNGIWSQCASLPGTLGQKDAPGAMMVNGKILLAVSPQGVNSSQSDANGIGPTSFYEYDYLTNSGNGGFSPAPSPGSGISGRAQGTKLLDLPSGNVLLSPGGGQLYVYKPDGSPLAAGQPNITKVQWNSNGSLHLTGTLFNGISQGAAYGDDEQMDTDFPLVRFSGGGNVYYGTTYNWSSTSVQTGSRIVTTEVTVPPAVLEFPEQWSLQVVANGIASPGVSFYSPVWVDFNYSGIQFGWEPFPYETLPQGVTAIAGSYPGGTIAIEGNPSTGHETVPYTISTPMTIISVSGPATINH